MTRAAPIHPFTRRELETGSPRGWRRFRSWLPCLAMLGSLALAQSEDKPTAAAPPSDPAKLTVRGFGLLGNRQLTKIIRLARADPVPPEFFDADFAEDAVLILLARLEETGHLEPRVVAQLALRDGRVIEHTWKVSFDPILPRPMQIKRLAFRALPGVRYFYDSIEIAGLESLTPAEARRYFISAEGLLQLKSMRI